MISKKSTTTTSTSTTGTATTTTQASTSGTSIQETSFAPSALIEEAGASLVDGHRVTTSTQPPAPPRTQPAHQVLPVAPPASKAVRPASSVRPGARATTIRWSDYPDPAPLQLVDSDGDGVTLRGSDEVYLIDSQSQLEPDDPLKLYKFASNNDVSTMNNVADDDANAADDEGGDDDDDDDDSEDERPARAVVVVGAERVMPPPRVLAPDLLRGFNMVLQAIDHCAVASMAYSHGQAMVGEYADQRVDRWNSPGPYVLRLMTHLCAPAFMFLLGMGTVYFARSRSILGWTGWAMFRHFFVRALILVIVNQIIGIFALGKLLPIVNIVLWALAVNYFVAGLAALVMPWTEGEVAECIVLPCLERRKKKRGSDGANRKERTALLLRRGTSYYIPDLPMGISEETRNRNRERYRHYRAFGTQPTQPVHDDDSEREDHERSSSPTPPAIAPMLPFIRSQAEVRSLNIAFHMHNVVLLCFCFITMWWNIWFDPAHGQCAPLPLANPPPPTYTSWTAFFIHPIFTKFFISTYPPFAWLSPTLMGVLYARITLHRPWKPLIVNLVNLSIGLIFVTLFVLTRLLHFGNMNENCLAMPEHLTMALSGKTNQYLASVRSFFYLTKYPPSPAFIFFSMGCNFLLLSMFGFVRPGGVRRFPFNVLLIFGTSPLFFFAVHLILYFALGLLVKQVFGVKLDFDDPNYPHAPGTRGKPAWGIGFGVLFWVNYILGLLIMLPLCRLFGRWKAKRPADSIWRFF